MDSAPGGHIQHAFACAILASLNVLPTGLTLHGVLVHQQCLDGAAFSCGAVSGVSMKQHGHLTPLQLNTLNHSTMQAVHTSALHGLV